MPVFWFALMLQLAFSVYGFTVARRLSHRAAVGGHVVRRDAFDFGDRIEHLILPAVVLSLLYLAHVEPLHALLDARSHPYRLHAHGGGEGLSSAQSHHEARLQERADPAGDDHRACGCRVSFAGAVVTETIFAWPGMGRLFINALAQFDFAVLMGYLCWSSFLVVLFNLLADICYAWLDPRVKYS